MPGGRIDDGFSLIPSATVFHLIADIRARKQDEQENRTIAHIRLVPWMFRLLSRQDCEVALAAAGRAYHE
jgi:hypothetical protein